MYLKILSYFLIVFINSCDSQDDGIRIHLGHREIPNHGLVIAQDIGVDPTGTNVALGLYCSTTSDTCCSDFPPNPDGTYSRDQFLGIHPSGSGSWLYAHVATASYPYIPRQVDQPSYIFGITRNERAVYVFRNRDENQLSLADGIWRCVIPDSNGREQTKYIGVYSNEFSNGTLKFGAPDTIQFSLVSEDPVVFNLTFMTTGGPATYVYWTRDGIHITPNSDSQYSTSQIVTDVALGNYLNILTVRGRLPRDYGVRVTNVRTPHFITPETVRILDYSQLQQGLITNATASQTRSYQDLSLTWNIPRVLVSRCCTGYEIEYRRCPSRYETDSTACDDSGVVIIHDRFITQYTLIGNAIQFQGSTYQMNITLLKQANYHLLNGIARLRVSLHFTVKGLLAPNITSVIELANITSVQVTWNQPLGGLTVDEYVVSYHRLNGRDGQCSSFQDEGSVTVKNIRSITLHLQAYSVYIVSVTARKEGLQNSSNGVQFETNSTDPSVSPQDLIIINSTFTSVTISWDSVECIQRNGLLTHYNVGYRPEGNDVGATNVTNVIQVHADQVGDEGSGYAYTFTGLKPSSHYIFTVAVVNSIGIGPTAVTQGKTINDIPKHFQLKFGRTDDCITWNRDKAEEIRTNVRSRLFEIIQERCQCKLPEENLLHGAFSCIHSHNETTYRSSIIGTHLYYDTELVALLQDWVNSGPTMPIQWFTVKIDPKCPVGIASLDEEECN